MKRYILTAGWAPAAGNAFQKARADIETLALASGLEPLPLFAPQTAGGNRLKQLWLMLACLLDWVRVGVRVRRGSMILAQYPMYPVKGGVLMRRMIPLIQRWKQCKFVALVHDLDSLRGIDGASAQANDLHLLPCFHRLICHNEKMQAQLIRQGIPEHKLVILGLFDYLTDAGFSTPSLAATVNIAGNLLPEKSGYLYAIRENPPCMLHLYGNGYVPDEGNEAVQYHGAMPAQALPAYLQGAFGLVWDGDSAQTCAGAFGEYLRYNNPHKASLYLAGGVPLVVWSGSALADIVRAERIGIVIDSLAQLGDALNAVTMEQYTHMTYKAREMGTALRQGDHFRKALESVIQCIDVES